jgi:endoglucanase
MIRKMKFYVAAVFMLGSCLSVSVAQEMNQVGYLSESVKRVFLPGEYQSKDFTVSNEKGEIVLAGKTTKGRFWEASGSKVCMANFCNVKEEGAYTIKIDGLSEEISFKVDDDAYKVIGKDLARMYYHARASMPLEEKYAGKYARPAGHPDDVVYVHSSAATAARPAGTVVSSPGGWYDAGDYNKYIINSGISTYTLLHAVDLYEKRVKNLELNIPESGNDVPDLLDESLYNLRWMLTMQDPNDGGVYHKLTSKKFIGVMMPEDDKSVRYVIGRSTAGALDFAATMAKAYRVLQKYEKSLPGLADSCLKAAEYAWEWCVKNPSVLYKKNPEDIKTGENTRIPKLLMSGYGLLQNCI